MNLDQLGGPSVRPYQPPGYYALFFKDLEGIKYEIVTHSKVIANEGAA